MDRRQTFDKAAGDYAAARPHYPQALFDELSHITGLNGSAAVLEVGCGAGQATAGLSKRARWTVAIDPGANLLAEARARLGSKTIEFLQTTFEDWAMTPEAFDLVASAQAWHWIAPNVSFTKAAGALKANGWLAVFGHVPMPIEEPFASIFRPLYEASAPGFWGSPPPQAAYLPEGLVEGMFRAADPFEPAIHRRYPWRWIMSGALLERYLRTDSSYASLPAERRHQLFGEMRQAVEARGNRLETLWETHLYLAKKRPDQAHLDNSPRSAVL